MNAPFFEYGAFGQDASLAVAFAIGLAFGWCLERSGLGNARKLAGQFYFEDLTVFKVMFTAIITAMLGVFWLGWVGFLDLSRVYVPETYILPQLVGGLIFGAGFGLAGLCPGTSCVSAATGRIDGVAVVGGMFFGVLATGLLFPVFEKFYESTGKGAYTIPQLTGLRDGVIILIVVAFGMLGFRLAEMLERRAARGGLSL